MQRTVADLQVIAESMPDPTKREEVLKIIARIARQKEEWPDSDELLRLKLDCHRQAGE
jgi:hypothetical protein